MQTNHHIPSRMRAIIYLICAALLWSTGGFFIKWVEWNPLAIAGARSAVGAVLIGIVLRKKDLSWSREQILCALAYAATVILFVVANKLTTAANTILLQYTAPIYVALFSFAFLKERVTALDWITTVVVFGGMVLFFMDDFDTRGLLGNILAILSGMTYAAMVMLMRRQKDGSPLSSVFLGNIITALIGFPFMFRSMPSAAGFLGITLLGTVQLGLPYILYSTAIKSVSALEAVLIPVIEPITNPIWVFLMLGEVPGKGAIAGGIIVLGAVTARCIITEIKSKKQETVHI
ncbi:EamA/RhaT family transporter [Biomaibacter acetigenes]|uniref:EamA/RhaT family transporter n=1 Tax=Biomaibacter acetigenes TaxID=2316383 RepID=A0A3G2R9I1_9FIRM|nr:DMT family transporter [Biomaibacter acetigenes]AYO32039.1 EamA/RhaT family transporter [Biomaibacter acetigenes]